MTETHLGATFDRHGGGKDLIFPHHENEIAQSQGDTGEGTFARYWMHNGFLNLRKPGEAAQQPTSLEEEVANKMSKSLGNVIGLDEVIDAVGGEAFRFFCVSHHYRSPVEFEYEVVDGQRRFISLELAERRLAYFYDTLAKIDAHGAAGDGPVLPEAEKLVPEATAALGDDFNAPVVIAALGEAAKLANKLIDEGKGIDKQLKKRTLARLGRDLRAVGTAVGVLGADPATYRRERRERLVKREHVDVAAVDKLLADRKAARAAKDFSRADAIRDELVRMKIAVFDTPAGTDWNVADDDGG
jgi:cysteinyl-tRNA synthetase